MPVVIRMPAMSPTMTEGALAKWRKKEGDMVAAGDVLAEIETDKATVELEATEDGKLAKLLVAEGASGVPVQQPIAVLLKPGEGEEDLRAVLGAGAAPATREAQSAGGPPVAERGAAPVPKTVAPGAPARLRASPLARRLAKERGVDLTRLKGTGPGGRIVKADVESARPGAPAAVPIAVPGAFPGAPPFAEEPLTPMRRTIARRMSESKREAPHFYLTIDCLADALLAGRDEINAALPEGEEAKVSLNDLVIRAAALALEEVPEANVAFSGQTLRRFARVDIAVAVAVPGGLVTPIVFDAARKGVAAIAREMRELSARAKAGRLLPREYEGGTFTISNLGMFGIKEFSAILNPPQACLLAVGQAAPRAIVEDGQVKAATVMTCTLSIDHRALDGAIGARLLAAFRRRIEHPFTMLL